MPTLLFPASPALNDTYTFNGITWIWNGSGWQLDSTSYVGPTGPAGPDGKPIVFFPEEPDEPIMVPGVPGPPGAQGLTGPAIVLFPEDPEEPLQIPGPIGLTGEQGVQGTPGVSVFVVDGEDGLDGLPVPGPTGATGSVGPQGVPGVPVFTIDGEDGLDGLPIPGPQGIQGPAGSTGSTGSQGLPGISVLVIDGEDGQDGMPIPGPPGSAGAGGGDVTGPASSTDNGIPRFDLTTGKILQTSYATISDDGVVSTLLNSGACAATLPATCWVMLTADYTLTSVSTEQKAFNTTTNGSLTLPTGVYEFDCFLYLTTMSATSGNLAFDPIGAGTAVTDRWGQQAVGFDNTTPLIVGARGGSASVTQQTPASAVTAGTGTGMVATFSGMFRISTGGTIIPSVTLVTAAAAVVKAGSWFKISKIGESSVTSVGAWT